MFSWFDTEHDFFGGHDAGHGVDWKLGPISPTCEEGRKLTTSREGFAEDDHIGFDVVPFVAEPEVRQWTRWRGDDLHLSGPT
jgi:hypothetical protein